MINIEGTCSLCAKDVPAKSHKNGDLLGGYGSRLFLVYFGDDLVGF
jgi:hypothetical protein